MSRDVTAGQRTRRVHLREQLPPGTLLRIEHDDTGYRIVPEVLGTDLESELPD
jgi:hypothetical protein